MRRYNMRFTFEKYDTAQKDGFRDFRKDIPEYAQTYIISQNDKMIDFVILEKIYLNTL